MNNIDLQAVTSVWVNAVQEYYKNKFPNVPLFAIPVPKFSDKTANGLTKCIIEFLTLSGHFAERVNSMGRMLDKRETYTDVLGQKKTVGSMKYIPSTGQFFWIEKLFWATTYILF